MKSKHSGNLLNFRTNVGLICLRCHRGGTNLQSEAQCNSRKEWKWEKVKIVSFFKNDLLLYKLHLPCNCSNFFDAIQFVLVGPKFATLRQEDRQHLLHEG